jgi:hypothetical protein
MRRNLGFTLNNVAQCLSKTHENKEAIETYRDRYKRAETLYKEDDTNPSLRTDYTNALYSLADILLNVSDVHLQDWTAALNLSEKAVDLTARRDPKNLVLYAQCLRLTKQPGLAQQAIEEASKLLPPEDKRTAEERLTASDVAFEMRKSGKEAANPSSSKSVKSKTKPRR